jgi:hypothetical protein
MSVDRVRRWGSGVLLAGGVTVATAIIGAGTARADDSVGSAGDTVSNAALTAPLAAGSGNQYDPAVVPYDLDPSNLFAPVYTVKPIGPEDVTMTDSATGEVDGAQDFGVSSLGFPVDTFTGDVEYTPTSFQVGTGLSGILSQLSQDLGLPGGYSEEILTSGSAGTVLPEPTAFLVSEFGFGYGNVFEESMNNAGTEATVGDFVLTPFGDDNISPIVDSFAGMPAM